MKFEETEKWQPIQNPDTTKRTPEEWSKIYGIKLQEKTTGWYNEYEWAYNFLKLKYIPSKLTEDNLPDWDSITSQEMRAQFLNRDLYLGADLGEKEVLKNQYIETNWIRKHMSRV